MKPVLSIWKGEVLVRESISEIAQTVARRRNVSLAELRGSRGAQPIPAARDEAMFLCASDGHLDFHIGRYFNRERSSVNDAVRRFRERTGRELSRPSPHRARWLRPEVCA